MDDPRIEWIRDRVFDALTISDPEIFEDLLNRDDGEPERAVAKFLNDAGDQKNVKKCEKYFKIRQKTRFFQKNSDFLVAVHEDEY